MGSIVPTSRKRSRSEGDSPLPQARMNMSSLPLSTIDMQAEATGEIAKKAKLFLTFGGTQIEIDIKHKAFKGMKTKPLEKAWEEARKLVPKGATDLRIHYSNLTIRYRDNSGEYQYIDLSNSDFRKDHAEFVELTEKIRAAAKKAWKDLGFASHFNDLSSRSRNGPRPFEICSKKWHDLMPTSMSHFLKKDQMQVLADHLEKSKANPNIAFSQIAAAEAFLQQFQGGVRHMKTQVENYIQSPNFKKERKEDREEAQKALKELEELEQDLWSMDRFALYWAVAMWGDRDPLKVSKEERFQLASEFSMAVEVALTHQLKPGEDNRWFASFSRNDQTKQDLLGMGPFIRAYSMDVGDAIIQDRLDYIKRADDQGTILKGASLVEFIMHNVMHLNDPSFDQTAAISSMHYHFPQPVKNGLNQILQGAKKTAQDTAKEAASAVQFRSTPWKDLKIENPNIKRLMGE